MKKWMKGLTIVGVVLVFAGTGISALAGVAGGIRYSGYEMRPFRRVMDNVFFSNNMGLGSLFKWHYNDDYFDNDYDYDYDHDDEYEYSDNRTISPKEEMVLAVSYKDIKKLDLDVENGAVKVVENPELDNEIRFYIKEKKYCSLKADKDDLDKEISVTYHSSRNRTHVEGIVEIPVGYKFAEAELEVKAGEMLVSSMTAGKLSLDVAAGILKVNAFESDALDASAEAGEIFAKGRVNSALKADVGAGNIEISLNGSEQDYNYQLDCSMGNIKIGASEYSGIAMDKSVNNGGAKSAQLACSMGNLNIGFY